VKDLGALIKINILENPAPDPARSCPKTPAPVAGFKFQIRPGSGQNVISGGTLTSTYLNYFYFFSLKNISG
jgi:hypothetical protein